MYLRCVFAEPVNSNDNDQWWATKENTLVNIKRLVTYNLRKLFAKHFFSLLLKRLTKLKIVKLKNSYFFCN